MNNQKQISLFERIRNCTKKANSIVLILVAIVMLYEEASMTPPIIKANVLETVYASNDAKSYNTDSMINASTTAEPGISKTVNMCLKSSSLELNSDKKDLMFTSSPYDKLNEKTSVKSDYLSIDEELAIAQEEYATILAEERRMQAIYDSIGLTGYLTTNLNVRSGPSVEETEVYDIYTYGTEVTYGIYNDYWAIINYGDTYAYIYREYISESPLIKDEGYYSERKGKTINLPSGLGTTNTFMAWQLVTAKNSPQYKLKCTVGQNFDEYGYGRIDGRYAIATTSTYGEVGDYIDVLRSDGSVLKAVIADIKNQTDLGCNKWGHNNGDVVIEFIVDSNTWYRSNNGALSGYDILTSTDPGSNNNMVISITNKGKCIE